MLSKKVYNLQANMLMTQYFQMQAKKNFMYPQNEKAKNDVAFENKEI